MDSITMDSITLEEFVVLLWKSWKQPDPVGIEKSWDNHQVTEQETDEIFLEGYQLEVLENYDLVYRKERLDRRTAARILHLFSKQVLKEPETDQVRAAFYIRDLSECRVCAGHIIQVYCKGIMGLSEQNFFAGKELAQSSLVNSWIEATLKSKKRVPPKALEMKGPQVISFSECVNLIQQVEKVIVLQLKQEENLQQEEWEPFLELKNVFLEKSIFRELTYRELQLNPIGVEENKQCPIVICSRRDPLDYVAAQILYKSGYAEVYVLIGQ